LGFNGVVVSDDIGMHAVSRLFDDPTAAVRLLLACTDLMMVCALLDRHGSLPRICGGHDLGAAAGDHFRKMRPRNLASVCVRCWSARRRNAVTSLSADVFERHRAAGGVVYLPRLLKLF